MTTEQVIDLTPYLPRLVLQWLTDEPEKTFRQIEGTVAFVDISGFTKLSERLAKRGKVGAEELTETIGGCFTELLAVAYADGGSLLKFGGDALLLFFTGEEHAVRAISAAAGMRATLRRIGTLDTPGGRVRLRMSVGVHSGRFDFFLVGTLHRELIVTGPAATQTVLMEQAAEAGEIVISEATAAALAHRHVGDAKGAGFLLRGTPAGPAAVEPPGSVAAGPAAERGLPATIREHLLGGGSEAEHRLATVTFIRFEGGDEVIAEQGAETLAQRLSDLIGTVQGAAAEHEVTFLGSDIDRDGGKIILAAGAPRATGADEEATLIAVRKVIEAGTPLPVKIGVNRGHVFAGDIGPHYRRTYTVMGDTVNLAARLMAAAQPGEILTPSSVLERSRTRFSTRALPPFSVKGKARPVHAFAVGPALAEDKSGPGATSPIVGRDLELAELLALLEEARAGRGGVAQIVGMPGMGASRIADEVRRSAGDTTTVFWTTGGPYAASSPYFPFRMLLRDILGIRRDEPSLEAAERLHARVEVEAPDLVAWLPLIGVVTDIPFPATPETEAVGAEFRRGQLERVVADLLSVALSGPTVIVFEDVHYFDEASWGLVAAIASAADEKPWLILTTRREDNEARPRELPPPTRTIVLGPLSAEAARSYAEAATEDAPLSEHDMDTIVERSGGNPLVLRELLAVARAAGTAEGLPDSVEALMTARIDQLPPRDRALLRNASVLGTVFDETLLEAVLDGAVPPQDDPVWMRLSQYVAPERSGYRFANPLIRDAAYEGLTFRARKALHARVGESLIASGRPLEEQAELLALHFFQAGRYFETWRFARVAGERAKAKYANVEAARFFQQAVEAARKLEGIPPDDLLAIQESLGDVWTAAGEYRKAEHAYAGARGVAEGDDMIDARLLLKEARIADRLGRFTVALRRLSRGLSLLDGAVERQATSQRAQLSMWYAAVRHEQGKDKEAIRWCHRAIADAEAAGDRKALAYANAILDWALDSMGQAGDHEHVKKALAIYEELEDVEGQAIALNNLGMAEYDAGRWTEAVDLYERSRLACERMGDPVRAGLTIFNIGEILSDQGRLKEAEPLLRRALRISRAAGERDGIAYALSQLGRVASREGRFEESLAFYEQARQEFEAAGAAGALIETGARIAECLVLRSDPEGALKLLGDLIDRDRARGGVSPTTALLLRARGEALLQLGDLAASRDALRESLEAARVRTSEFETALTLRRLAQLGELEGSPDPESAERSRRILAGLGVVEIADPPPMGGGSGLSRS